MGERLLNWGVIGANNIARSRMIPAINGDPHSRVAGNDGVRALTVTLAAESAATGKAVAISQT
jgi:predicted dehydrogenase